MTDAMRRCFTLEILPGVFAIARLERGSRIPEWASGGPLLSITQTEAETSIVCLAEAVPSGTIWQRGFRCLRVVGPLDFAEVGVLESLARPLAEAGISIFAISTFDTDYVLVAEPDLEAALTALVAAGHAIRSPDVH